MMDILISIIWSWVPVIILLLFLLFPPFFVLRNRQVLGFEKVVWFVSVLVTSYMGLMLFLIYLKIDGRLRVQA